MVSRGRTASTSSAARFAGAVSTDITRATISPTQPLGLRDWRAIHSGLAIAVAPVAKSESHARHVRETGAEERGSEAERELVPSRDAASRNHEAVADRH